MPQAVLSFAQVQKDLLDWFDQNSRNFSFRRDRTPYRVLVAEFMLQQTRAETADTYFERFMERWPTLEKLAQTSQEDLLALWSGLGYYRRAVHLHDTARHLVRYHQGQIPQDPETLLQLPGIGPYTAAAIASLAFGERVAAVDGNVVRVVSRLTRLQLENGNPASRQAAAQYLEKDLSDRRPGDVNEALMDLSAQICKPRNPSCIQCPLQISCPTADQGDWDRFPRRRPATAKSTEKLTYLFLTDGIRIYLRQRDEGLLRATWEPIRLSGHKSNQAIRRLLDRKLTILDRERREHAFSHRIWDVFLVLARTEGPIGSEIPGCLRVDGRDYQPRALDQLDGLAFSALFSPPLSRLPELLKSNDQ